MYVGFSGRETGAARFSREKNRNAGLAILDRLAAGADNDTQIGFSVPLPPCVRFVLMDLALARSIFNVMLWMGLLLGIMTFGVFLLRRVRGKPAKEESSASELLSKFRELHSRGEVSDAEYRTIKTTLAAQLQQQLKGNGEKG